MPGFRHSIAQAITTFKEPYAILVDSAGQIEDYAVTSNHSPCAFAHILRHFRELNIDRSLLKIIFAITVYVADLTEWYSGHTSLTDPIDLQKHASLLMYRLFTWHQCNERSAASGSTTTAALDRSICLALLIFMVHATEPNVGSFGLRLTTTVTKPTPITPRGTTVRVEEIARRAVLGVDLGRSGRKKSVKV